MRYLYRPNHPDANENGMIDAELAYEGFTPSGAPYVISDSMDAIKHHGTGLMTDSKSGFRKMTKATGCYEVGNETMKPRGQIRLDKRQRKEDIRRAIYELRNGRSGA